MTVRVKICGVTTPEDAALAARLGADAVGVLVGLSHASEDELDPEPAGAILATLPPFVVGTLVTHRTRLEDVQRLCRATRPHAVQLHGDVADDVIPGLRELFPSLRIVKTVTRTATPTTKRTANKRNGTAHPSLLSHMRLPWPVRCYPLVAR
jgi:phosphoribosylanthranilate isomerase